MSYFFPNPTTEYEFPLLFFCKERGYFKRWVSKEKLIEDAINSNLYDLMTEGKLVNIDIPFQIWELTKHMYGFAPRYVFTFLDNLEEEVCFDSLLDALHFIEQFSCEDINI